MVVTLAKKDTFNHNGQKALKRVPSWQLLLLMEPAVKVRLLVGFLTRANQIITRFRYPCTAIPCLSPQHSRAVSVAVPHTATGHSCRLSLLGLTSQGLDRFLQTGVEHLIAFELRRCHG
jgi:hypothetical protein